MGFVDKLNKGLLFSKWKQNFFVLGAMGLLRFKQPG